MLYSFFFAYFFQKGLGEIIFNSFDWSGIVA